MPASHPEFGPMRAGVQLVAVAGLTAAMSLVYIIITARFLGPQQYGDFWVALSLLYFCTVAVNPIGPTVSRIVALLIARGRPQEIFAMRRRLLGRVVPAAVIMLIGGPLLAHLVAALLHLPSVAPLVISVVAVAIYGVAMLDRGILQGARRFREYNLNTLLESSLRLAGAAVLLKVSASATMAMLAYAASLMIAEGMLALRLGRESREVSVAAPLSWSEFNRIGTPILTMMLALAVYQNVDSFAVKRYFASTDAGIYGAAAALARTFTVILGPLYVLAVPTLTEVRERGASVISAGVRICGAYLALATIPFAAFALFGSPLIVLLYGAPFGGAVRVLLPLSGIVIIGNLALLGAQILATSEHLVPVWLYCAVAAGEVLAISRYHPSISSIISIGYVAQGCAAVVVGIALLLTTMRLKRVQIHDAGNSSSPK